MPVDMADTKECPLCGETMRLTIRDVSELVPGTGQTTTRNAREWVCPECDYWEEAEEEDRT
jgi:YgiT-type zinc finger domain-containing protein